MMLSTGCSTDAGGWGTAIGAGAEYDPAGRGPNVRRRMSPGKQSRETGRGCGQSLNRSGGRNHAAWVFGAVRGSVQRGSGTEGCLVGHRAMVSPMAAAASRQARLCVSRKKRRKRPQPEDSNQQNGKRTPHNPRMRLDVASLQKFGRLLSYRTSVADIGPVPFFAGCPPIERYGGAGVKKGAPSFAYLAEDGVFEQTEDQSRQAGRSGAVNRPHPLQLGISGKTEAPA